jgi:GH25 family lysozyme M1 (1,4-beta-N-acetylmuramidase)
LISVNQASDPTFKKARQISRKVTKKIGSKHFFDFTLYYLST